MTKFQLNYPFKESAPKQNCNLYARNSKSEYISFFCQWNTKGENWNNINNNNNDDVNMILILLNIWTKIQ